MRLSVCLMAVNEEKIVGRCLESVKDIADEIVVGIDSKTKDNTEAVAEKYTKNILHLKHNDNFHLLKKKVIEKCTGDWILQLDADEVVTPELAKEIKTVIKSNSSKNGYWIPRLNYFLGRFLRKGGAYPDPTLRLYRRGYGTLPARGVHEQAEVKGETGTLKNYMEHYGDPTFWHYINRFNRYTDLEAEKVTGGVLANFFVKPLVDPMQGFLTIYFRHLGFLDGFPGFIWALFSALHFPVAYMKHYESCINKTAV